MKNKIRFHPQAIEEVEKARDWYAGRSILAAHAFVNELSHAVGKIQEEPQRWPEFTSETRRYIFPKFPFSLIYRIKGDVIEVIAVSHHKRKPGYWGKR